ncbi:MAG: M6 family metalloprotease domain-containing protein [Endomicrobiia bacterium]
MKEKIFLLSKKNVLVIINFFVLFFYFSSYLYSSAPHISGKYIEGQPKVRIKVNKEAIGLRRRGAPGIEIAKALNVVGTKKVAVIIVNFPDKNFDSNWHIQASTTFSKLKEYYNEVSYGKLNLEVTFFHSGGSTTVLSGTETAYTMSQTMSYYGQDTAESLANLIKHALNATNTGVNSRLVNKTTFNYVMVLHAGYGNESTTNPSDIWSVYVDWTGSVNGFTDGTIVPEKESNASPVGVTCHEFGHQLGLPDLYHQEGVYQYSRVGKWCLMDYGTWLGTPQGSSPSHLSAWCKYYLGWADVKIISTTVRNYELPYCQSVSSGFIKIPIVVSNNPEKEYFLLEYRKKVFFDSYLPGEGVLIWRIDDTIASDSVRLTYNNINSGSPNYGVDLVEADKIESYTTLYGDAGDPFPGNKNVTDFSVIDYGIKAYNGETFPLFITNISIDNTKARFNILYEFNLQNISEGQLVVGNNYTFAGRLMLIGFNLIKEDKVQICVYDMSGRVVKTFEEQYFPSGKNQILWYGTDNDGNKLSPGLYFISFKNSSETRVEKFIIKRQP